MIKNSMLMLCILFCSSVFSQEKLAVVYNWQLTAVNKQDIKSISQKVNTVISSDNTMTFDAEPFSLDVKIQADGKDSYKVRLALKEFADDDNSTRLLQKQVLQHSAIINQSNQISFVFGDYQFDSRIFAGYL